MESDSCFRLQRYKLLKAIHNHYRTIVEVIFVVSDYKDTIFSNQFTTNRSLGAVCRNACHCVSRGCDITLVPKIALD